MVPSLGIWILAAVACCSREIVSPPLPMIRPTQPSGTGTRVGGPNTGSMAGMPASMPATRFRISNSASRTCASSWPEIVSVRTAGLSASASWGMRTCAPERSWSDLMVAPPLPMMRPTLELSTATVLEQGPSPPPPRKRVRSISSRSFLARSTPSGVPVSAIRRVWGAPGSAPAGNGSGSLAIWQRTPNSVWSRLTLSPPRPMTRPTMELGTRASYVVSPARASAGATRHFSSASLASTRAVDGSPPSRRAIWRSLTRLRVSGSVNMALTSASVAATASGAPSMETCKGRPSSSCAGADQEPCWPVEGVARLEPRPRMITLHLLRSWSSLSDAPRGPRMRPMKHTLGNSLLGM
mmetsp:Transcript_5070/g.15012  ORF Transcript_5070/g.15012 Transcript_5070/m.15012 type:complete len:353 (-) Transcript_5070:550-1608(-)